MMRRLLTIFGMIVCGIACEARCAQLADQIAKLDDPAEMAAVVKAGDAAVPELCAALKGPRADLAAKAVGQIKSKAALPALLELVSSKDAELRATVAWALTRCGGPEASAALITLALDPYPPVRVAAVIGLTELHTPEADQALKAATADPLEMVRMAAAESIRHGNRTDLFSCLTPRLAYEVRRVPNETAATPEEKAKLVEKVFWTEPRVQIRSAVIRALGDAKATDAVPILIESLEREDSFNRQAIIQAIESMGTNVVGVCLGRIVPMPYDKDAIENHLPILINNGTLAVIAGKLGDARCVPTLLNTLKLPRKDMGSDKDLTELYIQSVQLLGRFKCERAGRPIAELLKETNIRQLSEAAQEALHEIGRSAARPLARNMDDWTLAPVFMKLLREPELRTPEARKGIMKFLTHEADEVRFEATQTLGLYIYEGILDEYDLPALEAMYMDPNSEVRAASREWQDKITQKLESRTSGEH
jgi:HEAT repeat protein